LLCDLMFIIFFFFFQAEDGIRDRDGGLEFRGVLFPSTYYKQCITKLLADNNKTE